MIYTAHQGKRYRATIRLGMFEQVASNTTIMGKLVDAGFSEVKVWGSGRDRFAEARWQSATRSAALPDQITNVVEIP